MAKIHLNNKYLPFATTKDRYCVVTGGRGSGKSFSITSLLCLMLLEDNRRILFLRKTLTSAHLSIIPEFLEKLELYGISDLFHITKTEIVHKTNGSAIFFRGIQSNSKDNTANLKSLQGISTVVIDEAEELTDEATFDKIDLSVRHKGITNKVVLILNPTTKEHWIYQRFFEGNGVIGAIIAGIKKKMKRKDFIVNLITSAFIAWITGAIVGYYLQVSNEVIYALCGLAGHFSDVLYDEVKKIFQSISDYFKKFLDKFI